MNYYFISIPVVLLFIAIPLIILSLPPPTIWRTPVDECSFTQCMSAPEALLAVSSIALALLATFISVKFALFFDGFIDATVLSLTFIAVSSSTFSTLLSPIIALCLAAYIVVRLRAFVDQPLTVPDPLFGPARRIADQVVGVLCSRVWNMGLAIRGYKVPYPEDTDEAVSEMGTPLPDAKGSVPHNLV